MSHTSSLPVHNQNCTIWQARTVRVSISTTLVQDFHTISYPHSHFSKLASLLYLICNDSLTIKTQITQNTCFCKSNVGIGERYQKSALATVKRLLLLALVPDVIHSLCPFHELHRHLASHNDDINKKLSYSRDSVRATSALRLPTSFKITDFGTTRNLVYHLLWAHNNNLGPISQFPSYVQY